MKPKYVTNVFPQSKFTFRLYDNKAKKTWQQIRAEQGCFAIINLSYFKHSDFSVDSHTMIAGKWMMKPTYHEYGICIDRTGKLSLGTETDAVYDYTVGLPPMYIDGKKHYSYQEQGKNGVSFIGIRPNGDVVPLISSKDFGMTGTEACKVLLALGCINILRFDGSWSSQGSLGPGLDVDPSQERKARIYLLVFKKNDSNKATTKGKREQVVDVASAEIGVSEPSGDDKYISWYNQATGSRLGMSVSWCAIFVSWVLRMAGVPETLAPNYCSCTSAMTIFKEKGTWRDRRDYTPKMGDLIFFDWDSKPSVSEHTGIVESIDPVYVHTIEGNTGNGTVARKKYKLTSSNIIGYVEWDGKPQTAGHTYNLITTIQTGLNSKYSSGLTVDGNFGPASKKAMIKAVQVEINRSYGGKLAVDGSFGPASRSACPDIKYGTKGDIVWIIQACLNIHGLKLSMDASYGPTTRSAVMLFQKSKGLKQDGICGSNTFAKLLAF